MLSIFFLSFAAIFFIIDPIGLVPIFLSMTARDTPEKCRAMAGRACLTAAGVLLFFAVAGTLILEIFSLTLGAFRVAGGLLLLLTALDMLRAKHAATRTSPEEEQESASLDDIAIVPLAMPLLAGPGAIATAMVLMAQHGSTWSGKVAVASALIAATAVAYLFLRGAQRVKKVLGQTGIAVLERVFGLILAAIAVQFVFDGAKSLLH